MPFLSELWIDLCVKGMIICFFMKTIICFLIILTFRWTLNHIFTNKHYELSSFILQNVVLAKLWFNINIKALSIIFILMYETLFQFQLFCVIHSYSTARVTKMIRSTSDAFHLMILSKVALCYNQKLYCDSIKMEILPFPNAYLSIQNF